MDYTVKALADLAGVTPRTLRWYDRLGLLQPARTSQAGYRIYGPAEVDRLQSILFYRELGFSLSEIQAFLDNPSYDRLTALQSHLAALETQRQRLNGLILTVQKTIAQMKGEMNMTDQEKFEAFKRRAVEGNEARFGKEVREKYGDAATGRANARILALTEEEYRQWKDLETEIQSGLASAVQSGADPAGPEGLRLAALHRRWLSFSWDPYSPNAHRGLGELYAQDPRFTAYYDRTVPGCAAFLRDAIRNYTK